MSLPNTRTLRLVLPAAYIFVIVAFCAASAWFAYRRFHSSDAAVLRLTEQTTASVECRNALDNAVRSAFALVSSGGTAAAETSRRCEELLGSAVRLAEAAPDDPGCADFLRTARAIDEQARLILNRRLRGEPFQAETIVSALAGASDSLRSIERSIAGSLMKQARPDDDLFFRTQLRSEIIVILLAVLLLVGYALVTRQIRRELKTLSDGTKELRTGNLDYRFREITPDEIGQVKYDFNMMARRIEKQSDELRSANAELREQAEKLIEAHQHKDRFLSNMSHELRTPLNSIIGFSELIEARGGSLAPEKLKSYSSRILTAANHLLSLITALLDLAKSGAGTLKPVPVDFDLSFAVSEMCEMLSPLAAGKK